MDSRVKEFLDYWNGTSTSLQGTQRARVTDLSCVNLLSRDTAVLFYYIDKRNVIKQNLANTDGRNGLAVAWACITNLIMRVV